MFIFKNIKIFFLYSSIKNSQIDPIFPIVDPNTFDNPNGSCYLISRVADCSPTTSWCVKFYYYFGKERYFYLLRRNQKLIRIYNFFSIKRGFFLIIVCFLELLSRELHDWFYESYIQYTSNVVDLFHHLNISVHCNIYSNCTFSDKCRKIN